MDISIQQKKFHSIVLKQYYVAPLDKKSLTIQKLLCYYQELACQKYPTEAKMSYALGMLYDARFKVTSTYIGKYSLLEYSLTVVDPAYIEDSDYTLSKIEEIFLSLTTPYMGKGKASPSLFKRAFEIYESDLLSLQESKQTVAYQNASSLYFKDTSRDFLVYGSLEELKQIKPKDLYEYYQQVKTQESIFLGTGNLEGIKHSTRITLTPKKNYLFKDRTPKQEYVYEKSSNQQSYLVMIFETNIYFNDALYPACLILNYLLGGSPSSTLFRIVREKYGLCYSISSEYIASTGIIVVSAVLNPKDEKKMLKAIDEAIESLKVNEIELEEARNYFLSAYDLGQDYIGTALHNYLLDHYFFDHPKSKNEAKMLKKITQDDVIKAFHKLQKTFTYLLGGKHHE